jgi:hypothetical protein
VFTAILTEDTETCISDSSSYLLETIPKQLILDDKELAEKEREKNLSAHTSFTFSL